MDRRVDDIKLGQLIEAVSAMQDDIKELTNMVQGNAKLAATLSTEVIALTTTAESVTKEIQNLNSLRDKGKGMVILLTYIGTGTVALAGIAHWVVDQIQGS